MKKMISVLMILMFSIITFAWTTHAAEENLDDIFWTEVEETAPAEPKTEQTPKKTNATVKTSLEITTDATTGHWEIVVSLDSDKELDSAKIIIELPEVVTVNTKSIAALDIFDSINAEETTLEWNKLTVSLFSANSVLAKGKAFMIPFAINPETEQKDYLFTVNNDSVLIDTENNELKTDSIETSIELFSALPAETTNKEEWILEMTLLTLILWAGLMVFSRRKKSV